MLLEHNIKIIKYLYKKYNRLEFEFQKPIIFIRNNSYLKASCKSTE